MTKNTTELKGLLSLLGEVMGTAQANGTTKQEGSIEEVLKHLGTIEKVFGGSKPFGGGQEIGEVNLAKIIGTLGTLQGLAGEKSEPVAPKRKETNLADGGEVFEMLKRALGDNKEASKVGEKFGLFDAVGATQNIPVGIANILKGIYNPDNPVGEDQCCGECEGCDGVESYNDVNYEDKIIGVASGAKDTGAKLGTYREHYLFSDIVRGIVEYKNVLIVGESEQANNALLRDLVAVSLYENKSKREVGVVESLRRAEDLEAVNTLALEGVNVLTTLRSNSIGGAINRLAELSKGTYVNNFDLIVEVGQEGKTSGNVIKNVMELTNFNR